MTVETRAFDPTRYLDSAEAIAGFIEEAFENGNPEFATVLKVAKALGLKLGVSPAAA